MARKKQEFKVEFVDAGEMSQEKYESMIEMLMEWLEDDIENQQSHFNQETRGHT